MKKPVIGAALAIVVLGGAAYTFNYERWVELPRARALIAAQLRDSDSTQFRNDRFTSSGWLCGELNSKNGSGGYVGFRRFVSASGAGIFYVEGEGKLGKPTTDDVVASLSKQTAYLRTLNSLEASYQPKNKPSQSDLEDFANREIFNDAWREHCEK